MITWTRPWRVSAMAMAADRFSAMAAMVIAGSAMNMATMAAMAAVTVDLHCHGGHGHGCNGRQSLALENIIISYAFNVA